MSGSDSFDFLFFFRAAGVHELRLLSDTFGCGAGPSGSSPPPTTQTAVLLTGSTDGCRCGWQVRQRTEGPTLAALGKGVREMQGVISSATSVEVRAARRLPAQHAPMSLTHTVFVTQSHQVARLTGEASKEW